MITPNGRHLGRVPDKDDDRDHLFRQAHPEAARVHLPPSVDLRAHLPPCFDQGQASSCGAHMGDALMCFLFPEVVAAAAGTATVGFSRLQVYKDVRLIEGTGDEDAGVETRDIFKTLQQTGAAPECFWPYDLTKLAQTPPPEVYAEAAKYKLSSYSRLETATNYLQCLASKYPFGMGIDVHESFDGDAIARTGIMTMPQPSEQIVGGHDMLAVGYILNFKSDPIFTSSGVDPTLVDDIALIVRNSWGTDWSPRFRGDFFMPLRYAVDAVHGNDAWTGRR